jgi:hypothetical protein
VREPWRAGAPAEQAREQRARNTVQALIEEGRAHEVYEYDESHNEAQLQAGLAADARAALAAVEAMLQQRLSDPSFDQTTARAYVALLHATREANGTGPDGESAEQRALSDLLGRGAHCPAPFSIFHAATWRHGRRLNVMLRGDPRSLASRMCQVGCDTLQVRRAEQAETN